MGQPNARRSPNEENERLNRARRAAELARRDAILHAAESQLSLIPHWLGKTLFAALHGRHQDMVDAVAEAIKATKEARRILRDYYDNPEGDNPG